MPPKVLNFSGSYSWRGIVFGLVHVVPGSVFGGGEARKLTYVNIMLTIGGKKYAIFALKYAIFV
jgi:hypothetical protein